jgi:hypothetical protein
MHSIKKKSKECRGGIPPSSNTNDGKTLMMATTLMMAKTPMMATTLIMAKH